MRRSVAVAARSLGVSSEKSESAVLAVMSNFVAHRRNSNENMVSAGFLIENRLEIVLPLIVTK